MAVRSRVRVISLMLSVSVVIGAWLAFDSTNLPFRPAGNASMVAALDDGSVPARAPVQGQKRDARPLALSQILPAKLSVTFKCEKDGRILSTDKPCGKDEKTLKVTAAEYPQPEMHDRLEQMRVGASVLEAARLERER